MRTMKLTTTMMVKPAMNVLNASNGVEQCLTYNSNDVVRFQKIFPDGFFARLSETFNQFALSKLWNAATTWQ